LAANGALLWDAHHPLERGILLGGLLLCALLTFSPVGSLLVLTVVTAAALLVGLTASRWLGIIVLPLGFVALSVLPFAIGRYGASLDSALAGTEWLWASPWWCPAGALRGLSLGLHAMACASCLLLFAATTPLHVCALALRRLGVSPTISDAVLLTGRLQAILRERFTARSQAARLRLGDASWRARWRTSGLLGAGLVIDTLDRAQRLERGLEARGGFGTESVVGTPWRSLSPRRMACNLLLLVTVAVCLVLLSFANA